MGFLAKERVVPGDTGETSLVPEVLEEDEQKMVQYWTMNLVQIVGGGSYLSAGIAFVKNNK